MRAFCILVVFSALETLAAINSLDCDSEPKGANCGGAGRCRGQVVPGGGQPGGDTAVAVIGPAEWC